MISPHWPLDGIGSQGVLVNPVYWQEDGDRIKAGPIWGDRPALIKDLQADVDNKVVPLHHNQAALQSGLCVAFEFFPLDARFGLPRLSQRGKSLNPAQTDLVRSQREEEELSFVTLVPLDGAWLAHRHAIQALMS